MAVRSFASAPKTTFDWQDPLASKNLLTEEELAIAETAERYCQERMMPRVLRMLSPIPRSNLMVLAVGAAALQPKLNNMPDSRRC